MQDSLDELSRDPRRRVRAVAWCTDSKGNEDREARDGNHVVERGGGHHKGRYVGLDPVALLRVLAPIALVVRAPVREPEPPEAMRLVAEPAAVVPRFASLRVERRYAAPSAHGGAVPRSTPRALFDRNAHATLTLLRYLRTAT